VIRHKTVLKDEKGEPLANAGGVAFCARRRRLWRAFRRPARTAQGADPRAGQDHLPEMALGPANASVTIIEYASMTCSHCAAFNANVFPKIKSEYIDTGKVRYVFREFPLDIKAAAGGRYWRAASPRAMPENISP